MTQPTVLEGNLCLPSTQPRLLAKPKRISELDGVRGLAIAMVLAYHYVGSLSHLGKYLNYLVLPTHLMWSGVDLFFVLSGLLIGGILLDNRESPNYFSVFYGRRVFRIFPIYYFMIAVQAVCTLAFPTSRLFSGTVPAWVFALYGQNLMGDFTRASIWLGVTWSLAVEEQFYLIFPLVVRFCTRKTLAMVAISVVIAAPLLRAVLIFDGGYGFEQVYPLLPCRSDALALGVIGALILGHDSARLWVARRRRVLYRYLVALLALFPTLLKWTTFRYVGTVGYSLTAFTYFLLIMLLLIAPHPLLLKAFRAPWLIWLGSISYCAYLIHQPVMYAVQTLIGAGPAAILSATALTLGIAKASWVLLEDRFVRIGHSRYRYASSDAGIRPICRPPAVRVSGLT